MADKYPTPRVTDRPLAWGDMSPDEQQTAKNMRSEGAQGLKSEMGRQAELARGRLDSSKGDSVNRALSTQANRLDLGASALNDNTDGSMERMADNTASLLLEGMTNPELQMPEDKGQPGTHWYFDAGKDIVERVGGAVGPKTATSMSSAMSVQRDPETERRALGAVVDAYKNAGKATFKDGQTVDFSQLSKDQFKALTDPDTRTEGIDTTALGGVQVAGAVAARDMMKEHLDTGVDRIHQNPTTAPKTFKYGESLAEAGDTAVNKPDVMGEYNRRWGVIKDKATGVVGTGQRSLDLYGLQGSNEGVLADEPRSLRNPKGGPGAVQDTWKEAFGNMHMMDREDIEKDAAPLKATADAGGWGSKSDAAGNMVARGDTSVKGESIRHALHEETDVMAARKIQSDLDNEFTTPVMGVQAGAWTVGRRIHRQATNKPGASADREFNAHVKSREEANQQASARDEEFRNAQTSLF